MIGFAGWLRRMSTPGAVLKPINGDAGTYGVFPKGDLRRRPLARLSAASLAKARAEGVLREISPDCYQLAVRPDVVAQRRAGDYRSPHQLIFEQPVVDGDGNTTTLRVNIADSPLARWMKPDVTTGRSWLSETEFEAGERLRADYHRSVLSERVTVSRPDGRALKSRSGRCPFIRNCRQGARLFSSRFRGAGPGQDFERGLPA